MGRSLGVDGARTARAASRTFFQLKIWGCTSMPRPRIPLEKAVLTGYTTRHPERFRKTHNQPKSGNLGPIGSPHDWLTDNAKEAWDEMADTMPWLNSSHRAIVGITAYLCGRFREDLLGVSGMNLLRLCLQSLGATPADFSKVGWSPPADDDDDPAAKYFR